MKMIIVWIGRIIGIVSNNVMVIGFGTYWFVIFVVHHDITYSEQEVNFWCFHYAFHTPFGFGYTFTLYFKSFFTSSVLYLHT